MKTSMPKAGEIEREWWVVDAAGKPVGRVAAHVAAVLRGKHKPTFAPHMDTGDHVVVINAAQAILTGAGKPGERLYRHSGYPGGLKYVTRGELMKKRPERYVERVIRGMLPHNRLGAQMYRKLKVYAGGAHPHEAQAPKPMTID